MNNEIENIVFQVEFYKDIVIRRNYRIEKCDYKTFSSLILNFFNNGITLDEVRQLKAQINSLNVRAQKIVNDLCEELRDDLDPESLDYDVDYDSDTSLGYIFGKSRVYGIDEIENPRLEKLNVVILRPELGIRLFSLDI